jgi:hypothetical protein
VEIKFLAFGSQWKWALDPMIGKSAGFGGWDKHQHFYLVMLVKVAFKKSFTNRPLPNPARKEA